jgi:uncharacterized protein YyaL (SSP411 family)
MPNRLINEKSPYLQQHAQNPVEWYPWGEEAFKEARRRDVPVFLSIGYSTCHWCHVMEWESFEDKETAESLNSSFICIKVDREERPDLDAVYMVACQMLTGGGGWPLTIITTPDQEPFWAGTYLPKTSRQGMLGLNDLTTSVGRLWKSDRFRLVSEAASIMETISQTPNVTTPTILNKTSLNEGFNQLSAIYDNQHFGFGYAPKFPSPHYLLFLLRYWSRTQNLNAIKMVKTTLNAMAWGEIHDQIGGGFHRYSTDKKWLIPHFEKMLYDQATLLLAYTEAYQATRDPLYAVTARDIADYTLQHLTSPEGAFYSAEDADSEGEEGKFYTWTLKEIKDELSAEEARVAILVYGVSEAGNTNERNGVNILHKVVSDEKLAQELGLPLTEYLETVKSIRSKLLKVRNERARPLLDDKILTDWNGLMIAAISKAGAVLGEDSYLKAAGKAVKFIQAEMSEGGLLHRYRLGEAAIPAFLDDYAYLAWGLLELYEATFDAKYLVEAEHLTTEAIKLFWDPDLGGFHMRRVSESSLPRVKETYYGAKPSGNSVMAMNLLRLGRSYEAEFEEKAEQLLSALASLVESNPVAHTYLLCALDYSIGPSYEVVVAGDSDSDDTRKILKALQGLYIPNKILLLKTPDLNYLLGYTAMMKSIDGKPAIFICRNRTCNLPVTNLKDALKLLNFTQTSEGVFY